MKLVYDKGCLSFEWKDYDHWVNPRENGRLPFHVQVSKFIAFTFSKWCGFGYQNIWYDGPNPCFKLFFVTIAWGYLTEEIPHHDNIKKLKKAELDANEPKYV